MLRVDYPAPAAGSPAMLTDNDIDYFYDEQQISDFALGRLTTIKVKLYKSGINDVIRTTQYRYDAAGRALEERVDDGDPVLSWTTYYQYDKEDQLAEITYPNSGQMYRFTRNKAGQITHFSWLPGWSQSIYIKDVQYQGSGGRVAEFGYTNSSFQPFQYQSRGERSFPSSGQPFRSGSSGNVESLRSVRHGGGAHRGLLHRVYSHGKTGLYTGYSCASLQSGGSGNCYKGNTSKNYSFDGLYRLQSSTGFSYQYDNNGNLTQIQKTGGTSWILQYDPSSNRLIKRYKSTNSAPASNNYKHFVGGQRKEDPYRTYIYHPNGRLALVSPKTAYVNAHNKTVFFVYDHLGRRIRKLTLPSSSSTSVTGVTLYFYDLYNRLIETYDTPDLTSTASKLSSWLYHGLSPIYSYQTRSDAQGNSFSSERNYLKDRLGRPAVVTNTEGQPIWRSVARPFGRETGYSLQNDPWTEVDISANPIQKTPYTTYDSLQVDRNLMKSGTFGLQLYFERLSIEFFYDTLSIYTETTWGFTDWLHTFTGNYQTGKFGNPGSSQGFWGSVFLFNPEGVNEYAAAGNQGGGIRFEFSSDGSIQWDGFKISKYRVWSIPDGERGYFTKNDNPVAAGQSTYTSSLGYALLQPWKRTYQQADAKLIRVCFRDFDLEDGKDFVEIRNASGNITEILTGTLFSICSAWVQGDKIEVQLYSDGNTQTNTGFVIEEVQTINPAKVQARFPGQWYEKDTEIKDSSGVLAYAGLHYNWNRFYDPEVGRYISTDPLGLQAGMNPYAYAGNNPANAIDFDGRRIIVIITRSYFWGIPLPLSIYMSHAALYMDRKNPDGSFKYKRIYDPNGRYTYLRTQDGITEMHEPGAIIEKANLKRFLNYHSEDEGISSKLLEFNTTEKTEGLIWKRAINGKTGYYGKGYRCASGVFNALMKPHGLFKNLKVKGLGISYGNLGQKGFNQRFISFLKPSTLYRALIKMNKHKVLKDPSLQ